MSQAKSFVVETSPSELRERYLATRAFTARLCESLEAEDCVIQSMRDVSPTRWHLAHTTWFFEEFALGRFADERPFHPAFKYLFNSYYNAVGAQFPRSERGMLSRPTVAEVWAYRDDVDRRLAGRLAESDDAQLAYIVELGIQHEQQHQELILTDIKHVLSRNPLFPVYREAPARDDDSPGSMRPPAAEWLEHDEAIYEIGHTGPGFAYDNESPRHRVLLEDFMIASRPVNCGEYLQFMADDGYRRAELWLSAGWQTVQQEGWQAPLYWHERPEGWSQFTLAGLRPLDPAEPVCHVSYFEADAFARWAGARLPTEAEWEVASAAVSSEQGNFADTLLAAGAALHPAAPPTEDVGAVRMFGDVWQWTASPYTAYPGYAPPDGALGEYNGKFMCNQFVLRGGSCATSSNHIRATYRNFFPPEARWQFCGFRLAR
ncbi:MAG: ergothioneine biosynthesis protein EgtB [Planctomycetota bacterium]|nr:MAG: ergothioneine biosynthesis protein EgtB [Planctomycetota bacterium]